MKNPSEQTHSSSTTTTIITTKSTITTTTAEESQRILDDWDEPFSSEELDAIEAAFEAAAAAASSSTPSSSSSSSIKTSRRSFSGDDDSDHPPKIRRLLPDSFALAPCPRNSTSRQANVKMKYPAMNFGGRIVYSQTTDEVEKATLEILKLLESKKCERGQAVLGLDIEWRPSFDRGIPQGKAAVMQICGDMTHCYVLHIIHSGIPDSLQSLLEDSSCIKVGVGIFNDAVKVFHDHNVSIKPVEDLSSLANQKLGGVPKQWSLSSLVETLTCKQLLKPNKIRLGNWEANYLSKAQLQYAATDAFASWYLYEVLKSFPDLPENQSGN